MRAEHFTAARRDDALARHAAVTVIVVMTPAFVIARPNAGLERVKPYANVVPRERGRFTYSGRRWSETEPRASQGPINSPVLTSIG